MELTPVNSSNIEACGHDPENNVLQVKFKGGKTYEYSGVTADEHAALMSAPSIGSHLHTHIKPKYRGEKV